MLPATNSIATVEAVTFAYAETPILNDLSLTLARGEIVAIMGPSGSGKSTLLDLLSGARKPQSGRITITPGKGQVPVTAMLQNHDTFEWLTIRKNLALSGHRDPAEIENTAEKLGLGGMLDRHPRQLSGGQRKRVALARCILADPAVLLLDEPFSALDMRTKLAIFDIIDSDPRNASRASIFATHSVEEAVILSDRILIFDGPPLSLKTEIIVNAAHPRGTEFLDSETFKRCESKAIEGLLKRKGNG